MSALVDSVAWVGLSGDLQAARCVSVACSGIEQASERRRRLGGIRDAKLQLNGSESRDRAAR
jgi:hypothetical protein